MRFSIEIPLATEAQIKAEASTRILSVFPEYAQMNMLATASELQEVAINGGSLTDEQASTKAALNAAWGWIKSVRTASNTIEEDPPTIDNLQTDDRWPANPA